MTLYELNQANYINLPTLAKEQLERKIPYIVSFIDKNKGNYFLVLERESRHYTLLTFKDGRYNPGAMARELLDLMQSFSEIKSIEDAGDMLEIWAVCDGECSMYAFFNYDAGVIEVS